MEGYGQFCPIAQAAEVLTERWTPLVLRELALTGSCRFNDIQRGVPLMSSSLLTKRLRQLERAGIVERRPRVEAKGSEYHLTPAGQELGPVLVQMGVWSERWLRRPIFEESPDTGLLMWWVRGTVNTDALTAGRTVIHFRFLRRRRSCATSGSSSPKRTCASAIRGSASTSPSAPTRRR